MDWRLNRTTVLEPRPWPANPARIDLRPTLRSVPVRAGFARSNILSMPVPISRRPDTPPSEATGWAKVYHFFGISLDAPYF